jgi:hypothetical protein
LWGAIRFVLSLDGVDPQLLMEGENLMWVSHDAVFVLQHPGDPITLRLVLQAPSCSGRFQILLLSYLNPVPLLSMALITFEHSKLTAQ